MRSNHHIKTVLAVALALSAIAAPAATARVELNPTDSTSAQPTYTSPVVQPNPDQQTASVTHASSTPGATIVRVTSPSGFDWGDAGVGAASGFALSMLTLGLTLVVSQRRGRRSSGSAALTS